MEERDKVNTCSSLVIVRKRIYKNLTRIQQHDSNISRVRLDG